jgi:hypothetical protein
MTVEDAGKHAGMAGLAGAYLAYCDCVRKGSGEKMNIVAVFSQGDDDNLMVGRNGIFYDRKGKDFDATITKIVSNPISIRQAFWSPYKKLVRMIDEHIAKRASAADAESNAKLAKAAEAAASIDKNAKKEEPKKIDVGAVAAMGVAFGALSAALAGILGLLKGIYPWQIPLILIGLMLVISGPSMILAYMKLRRRNLGPILDANGWAVNAKAKINVPFGTSLTGIAKLPAGATVDSTDRYAAKSSFLPKLVVFALILVCAWSFLNDDQGRLYGWTDGKYGNPPSKEVSEQREAAKKSAKDKAEAEAQERKAGEAKKIEAAAAAAASTATNAPAAK